jgi:hypothetical protein
MRTDITLPIIDRLSVRHYPLYPGQDGTGLDLEIADGVTVLAGINGIGKTTLLNLLLRMLVGPCDPSKGEQDLGRVSKRQLVVRRQYSYFQDRVPDALGEDALATLVFRLGGKTLTVTRFLRDMTLKTVVIGKSRMKVTTETAFIDELARLAGVGSGYDFHILVRYLQFFSEERMPILWSPGTQFEFFKILFFDEELSRQLNQTYADVQRVDTNYRNRLNQMKRREEKLPKPVDSAGIEVNALRGMVKEATAAFEDVDQRYQQQYASYHSLERDAFQLEGSLTEAEAQLTMFEREFTHADALYIAQALPSLDDKLQFLMQGLGAASGCFVCGTRGRKEAAAISRELRQGHCFVCHSPIKGSAQSNVVPLTTLKVRTLEQEMAVAHDQIRAVQQRRVSTEQQQTNAAIALKVLATERNAAMHALERLQAQMPVEEQGGVADAWHEIERERATLKLLAADRDALVDVYRLAIDAGQLEMDALKEDLRETFSGYAEAFLQESVTISFKRLTPFKLATGARQVNIPTFSVAMTSSTHLQARERQSSDNVSESQKEFLDLAFRMSLLDLIKPKGGMTMVIETPEASLDSWFMRRAAQLMRRFAEASRGQSRKLLATSNLNGTIMIPALLGVVDGDGGVHKLDAAHAHHLVDLMRLTAKATVLKQEGARTLLEEEMARYAHG